MNRKPACLIMAVIMIFALTVTAFAVPGEGDASIKFKAGDTTIIDPPDIDGVTNSNLNFGEWEVTPFYKVYESYGANAAEGVPDAERFVGFSLLHTNAADLWNVEVSIAGFYIDGTELTMDGFELTLTPDTDGNAPGGKPTPITTDGNEPNNNRPTARTAVISAGNNGAAGDKELIFNAAVGNGVGAWGGNWTGSLEVLADSATTIGSATAIMNWSVNNTPA